MENLTTIQLIDLLKSYTELFYLPYAESIEDKEEMYSVRKNILTELMKRLEIEKGE